MFERFFQNLLNHGLEYFKKYYGVYRGIVSRNDDPEQRGRIQAHVPSVGQQFALDVWIEPAFDGAGSNRGVFWPPEVGDGVRVVFDKGDPSKPSVYWGGWFGSEDLPDEFSTSTVAIGGLPRQVPEKRGFVTRKGHRVIFNDADGEESLEIAWHRPSPLDASVTDRAVSADREEGDTSLLRFTGDSILIENKDGSTIEITDGKVFVNIDQVVLVGDDQDAVRGNDLLQYLKTHVHGTFWGPSSPPITPPPPTILSKNVKLK